MRELASLHDNRLRAAGKGFRDSDELAFFIVENFQGFGSVFVFQWICLRIDWLAGDGVDDLNERNCDA